MRVVQGWARNLLELAMTVRRAAMSAVDHDALTLGQATAYAAMLALFPGLVVVAAVFDLLPSTAPLRMQLALFFDSVLPSTVSPLLESYFASSHVTAYTTRALVASGVVSFTGAASVMATLMEGFRRAHDLPLPRGSFWPLRGRACALVFLALMPMAGASALVVFGHVITQGLVSAMGPESRVVVFVIADGLRWGIAFLGSVGIFAVIYHLGTDPGARLWERLYTEGLEPMMRQPWVLLRRDWSWRASLPGATLATALWFVTTLVFGVYVTRFANYSQVYGPLGAGVALLVWLYLIALSVLVGAEFNAQRAPQGPPRRPAEITAALWKVPSRGRRRTGRMGVG